MIKTACKFCLLLLVLSSCSVQKKTRRQAQQSLLRVPELSSAHIGISLYDPSSAQYLYNYQGDHYFVPASNTKIMTCYAAMKYLGDSIPGIRYLINGDQLDIYPTGDPGFMQAEFVQQPVLNLLKTPVYRQINMHLPKTAFKPFGRGWSWDDYQAAYMAARSVMPMYGNVVQFEKKQGQLVITPAISDFVPEGNNTTRGFRITRAMDANRFYIYNDRDSNATSADISFRPHGFGAEPFAIEQKMLAAIIPGKKWVTDTGQAPANARLVNARHTDSLLKPMMHRSDNFYAEQSLLMVSNEVLGYMDDRKIIDSLLKTDFAALPQKPNWVDGSGLSRYNLFSPQDFVTVLNKLRNEFDWKRITTIFPTGGTGTISGLYKNMQGKIYAKTGTLSGQVAFSGYLITSKNKTLIFSVLVNNHQTSALTVRKAVEQFLAQVYQSN